MRWIRDHANVAVLADESVYSATDAANVIAMQAADVLGLKFYKCGGLRRSREIAVVANASGHQVNCAGTANGSYIEAIAGAHLCASIPNHAFGAEFMMGLPAVAADTLVMNRPIDIKDGYCNVPCLPGLGIDIDEAELKRHELAHEVISAK
jgi:muconate cycloisomerase